MHGGPAAPFVHPQRLAVQPYPPQQPHPSPHGPPQTAMRPQQPPAGESVWRTNTAPDGRIYYYNIVTRQTTWTKPDELKTPLERVLATCPWKEYTTPDGRKYYHNAQTKITTWQMPEEYRDLVQKFGSETIDSSAPKPAAHGSPTIQTNSAAATASSAGPDTPKTLESAAAASAAKDAGPASATTSVTSLAPSVALAAESTSGSSALLVLDFKTKQEAEEAFIKMLVDSGIDYNWNWEDVIRKTHNNPFYRSLKTLPERKETFERWCEKCRSRDRELKRSKRESDIAILRKLYESRPEITSTSTYKSVFAMFKDNAKFAKTDEENRRGVLADYRDELFKAEKEAEAERRKENMIKIRMLLKKLPITLATSWKEVQLMYAAHEEYDDNLRRMDPLDILIAFEDHIQELETQARQERTQRSRIEYRKERIRRDGMRALLADLHARAIIHAKSKWKDVYPHIKDDPRLLDMLGQQGSSPLDLFWDVIVSLEERYRVERRYISDMLRRADDEITSETTFEAFCARYERDLGRIDPTNLRLIFDDYHARAVSRAKEEKRYQERKLRRRMDDFKSVLKRVSNPSIKVDSTWESVRPRVADREEYEVLDEVQRVEVFERFIARLKEKKQEQQQKLADVSGGEEGEVVELEPGEELEEGEEQDDHYRRRRSGRSSRKRSRHGRSRRSGSTSSEASDRDDDDDRRDRTRDRRRDRGHSSSRSKRKDRSSSESDGSDEHRESSKRHRRRDKRSKASDGKESKRDHEDDKSDAEGARSSRSRRDHRSPDKSKPRRDSSSEEEGELRG